VALRGPQTEGEMAPEISLENQRPATYNYTEHVDSRMKEIAEKKAAARKVVVKEPAE
jgi:hypothetical protein